MPATRSSAARRRAQISDAPYSSAPPSSPPRLDSEVIIISSDDEADPEPTPRRHPRTARKGKGRAFHVAEEDVIDVSDSSDKKTSGQSRGSHRPSRKAKQAKEACGERCSATQRAKQLEADLAKAREERDRAQAASKQAQLEIEAVEAAAETKIAAAKASNSQGVPIDALEDIICCEICTHKMWSPYTLSGCGHTFCQSCLSDWFSTAHAQHLAAHPGYPAHPPPVDADTYARLPAHVRAHIPQQPGPKYTCPTCRQAVHRRPTESFALKNVVRVVAAARGEHSPRKPTPAPARATRGGRAAKAAAPAPPVDPWAGFFGPR